MEDLVLQKERPPGQTGTIIDLFGIRRRPGCWWIHRAGFCSRFSLLNVPTSDVCLLSVKRKRCTERGRDQCTESTDYWTGLTGSGPARRFSLLTCRRCWTAEQMITKRLKMTPNKRKGSGAEGESKQGGRFTEPQHRESNQRPWATASVPAQVRGNPRLSLTSSVCVTDQNWITYVQREKTCGKDL